MMLCEFGETQLLKVLNYIQHLNYIQPLPMVIGVDL